VSTPLTVTVAVPVLNEARHISACLAALESQTYGDIVEILVVDGGSDDETRDLAGQVAGVRILENDERVQAAALNLAIHEAKGDVLVRVDGHCIVAPDYVERCVATLARTGAAMVGGGMTPEAEGWRAGGIAAAMRSPFGAGPARFHVGGQAGWVDTVYLGAYRVDTAKAVGGYSLEPVSEDGEFAIRMRRAGGVYYDPAIRSTYVPRRTFTSLARQFHRYGAMRAATVVRHPHSVKPRQLASPLLVVGLASPARRPLLGAYGLVVAAAAFRERRHPGVVPGLVGALPVMHLSWGAGFLLGLGRSFGSARRRTAA